MIISATEEVLIAEGKQWKSSFSCSAGNSMNNERIEYWLFCHFGSDEVPSSLLGNETTVPL